MKFSSAVVLLLMLLALGGMPARAAEPDSDQATTDGAETTTEAAEDEPVDEADIDAALAEEIRAAEAAQAAAPAGESEETFVPTVQISEDLSVSFPVDI